MSRDPSSGIVVRTMDDLAGAEAAQELLTAIWGGGSGPVIRSNLIRAFQISGNYVAGAFDADRLVGASLGFLGRHQGQIHLHSHITGVDISVQDRGVGFALKQHQRTWALEMGVGEVVWTFDPLVRRNGYFNVAKLGAEIIGYHQNFYGDMHDQLNRHEESDRCLVSWRVGSAAATSASQRKPRDVSDHLNRAVKVLTEDREGRPIVKLAEADILAVQIPEDVVAMRLEDPSAAVAWRRALREVLQWAFAAGYVITGMEPAAGYLLERSSGRANRVVDDEPVL